MKFTMPSNSYRQSSVIPFIREEDSVKVVLITSRRRKRWIFPKGIVEPDLSPQASAVKEAEEEAGVFGNVFFDKIGEYEYKKWGGTCHVEVFPMEVTRMLEEWDEDDRERRVTGLDKAESLLKDPKLVKILKKLPDYLDNLPEHLERAN